MLGSVCHTVSVRLAALGHIALKKLVLQHATLLVMELWDLLTCLEICIYCIVALYGSTLALQGPKAADLIVQICSRVNTLVSVVLTLLLF